MRFQRECTLTSMVATSNLSQAERNAGLIRELTRRFSAGESIDPVLHPDFRIQQPESLPHGGWHQGIAGMKEMGALFAEHWSRTIADVHVYGSDEIVTQLSTQTWTANTTGRTVTVDVLELFQITDGLISEIRVFQQDTHALLETLSAQ